MKTTIDIPELLYRKAKVRAAQSGISLRELVIASLDQAISPHATHTSATGPAFEVDKTGFPVLTGRSDVCVSNELVNRIREEEGI